MDSRCHIQIYISQEWLVTNRPFLLPSGNPSFMGINHTISKAMFHRFLCVYQLARGWETLGSSDRIPIAPNRSLHSPLDSQKLPKPTHSSKNHNFSFFFVCLPGKSTNIDQLFLKKKTGWPVTLALCAFSTQELRSLAGVEA